MTKKQRMRETEEAFIRLRNSIGGVILMALKGKKVVKAKVAGIAEGKLTDEQIESYGLTPYDTMFPKKLEHSELGNLVRFNCSPEQLKKLVEKDETIYFTTFWSSRRIKMINYGESFYVPPPATGFEYDLDFASVCISCVTVDRFYAMSVFTEALYRVEAEDFDPIKFNNPVCGEEEIYISGSLPFAMYKAA